jgi:hypothetical protein
MSSRIGSRLPSNVASCTSPETSASRSNQHVLVQQLLRALSFVMNVRRLIGSRGANIAKCAQEHLRLLQVTGGQNLNIGVTQRWSVARDGLI